MNKTITVILLLFYSITGISQTNEFIIIDEATNQPISNVNVLSTATNEGTVSNAEGKIKVPTSSDVFTLSHVGYLTREVVFNKEQDFIYLTPNTIELREVSLSNIDLKKKLRHVIEKYEELYVTSSVVFESTYKESLKVANQLARLSQVQLNWWNKTYQYDFDKAFNKQNQMSLTAIDYSKILDNKTILANGGFLANANFFQFVHLNYYPEFLLSYGRDFHISSIENQGQVTKIVFDGAIEVNQETVSHLQESEIYFDNDTGAIVRLYWQIIYEPMPVEGLSRSTKTPYTSLMKKHELGIFFNELRGSKLGLGSFYSRISADVKYQDKHEQVEIEQNLFITKRGGSEKISRKDRIDLERPLYENFPMSVNLESKILLSREEAEFIRVGSE